MAKKRADTRSLVAGRNPVREALEAGKGLEKLFIQNGIDGRFGAQMRALAKEAGVPVQSVPPQRLESLVPGVNHQGVVLLQAEVEYLDVDDMLREIAPEHEDVKERKPLILLLDGIQDPHNLGAILRTAVAVG
ncbi:MAG: 23S rRNA (guanosine(2251)-2'-O)-methyltransferase RlmB, partial [Rhodothermales bacterium]|nr:23S rRNA (guanosine(2251)-2'-O)-methyltransferase RlmB [Rhodothermales bacterium]